MHRIELGGGACVDMDTSRRSREKVLDELRAGISGCAEDSIGRGGRTIFRSLHGRLFTEKYTKGYKRKSVSFGLANLRILPRSRHSIVNWRLVRHGQIEIQFGGQCYLYSSTVLEHKIQWHREMGHLRFLNHPQFSLKSMFPGSYKHRAPTISYFYEYVEAIIGETSGMMSVWKRRGTREEEL